MLDSKGRKVSPFTHEDFEGVKQMPEWRNFYAFGPGHRDFSFDYDGPAEEPKGKILPIDDESSSIRG